MGRDKTPEVTGLYDISGASNRRVEPDLVGNAQDGACVTAHRLTLYLPLNFGWVRRLDVWLRTCAII